MLKPDSDKFFYKIVIKIKNQTYEKTKNSEEYIISKLYKILNQKGV